MNSINKNALNQVPEGSVIFKEGENVDCIGLVLRGRIEINNRGSKVIAGAGTFIGLSDFVAKRYQATYYAIDQVIIYVFKMDVYEDLRQAVGMNKDYGGFLIASQTRYIKELERIRRELSSQREQLMNFLNDTYKEFVTFSVRTGYSIKDIPRVTEYHSDNSDIDDYKDAILYYCASSELSLDLFKAFYYNPKLSVYTAGQQVDVINTLLRENAALTCSIVEILDSLYSEQEECLLKQIVTLIKDTSEDKSTTLSISHLFDRCVEEVNTIELLLSKNSGYELNINHEYLENSYYKIMSGDFTKENEELGESDQVEVNEEAILSTVRGSLDKILNYSGLIQEEQEEFRDLLSEFMHLEDKLSTADDARKLRRKISEHYYKLYKNVLLKAFEKDDADIVIRAFLNYGFIDERFLSTEQIIDLFTLQFDQQNNTPCRDRKSVV